MVRSYGAVVTGLASLGLYSWTLTPDVGAVDSGELTLAASTLGVAHPPGFPLYVLLVHPFSWLPFGSIAARINFASAVFGALSAALVFQLALSLVPPSGARTAGARGGQKTVGLPITNRAADEWPTICGAAMAASLFASLRALGLIRFGGHLPKGGYDVRNGRITQSAAPPTLHG